MGFKIRLTGAVVVTTVLISGGGLGYIEQQASRVDLSLPQAGNDHSIIYASDGQTILGHIASASSNSAQLTDEQVSVLLRHAHMAAEDRSFYTHGAISLKGAAWAAYTNARKGALAAGGSTITQQMVKNVWLSQERTIDRKTREVYFAYRAEQEFTKDQILTMYLNSNYYGRGAYGVEDAAWVWFGHSATELNDLTVPLQVAKASFLAALIQQPSRFDNPVPGQPNQLVNMQAIVDRQIYILDGLRELEGVSELVPPAVVEQAKRLLPLPVTATTRPSGRTQDGDPYIMGYVKDWLTAWQVEVAKQDGLTDEAAENQGTSATEAMLARGGLKIRTSINANLQIALAQAVQARLPKNGLTAGVVILDPRTGGVAAMYGGNNPAEPNHALYSSRPVGSTMKAVVLADLVRNGISVQSKFAAPSHIVMNGSEIWNDDRKAAEDCELTVADALAYSNNPVAIEMITGKMVSCDNPAKLRDIESGYPVSPASVAELAREMGADDSLVPGKTSPAQIDEVPTLALGVNSLSPLKLGVMGATLANHGLHTKPHFVGTITTRDGRNVFEHQIEQNKVLKPEETAVVNQVLTGVFTKGTARGAQVKGLPLAGKTGTTPKTAWMIAWSAVDPNGTSPAWVCSASAGFPDDRPTDGLWGADIGKICSDFFAIALQGAPRVPFAEADLSTGKAIG